MPAKKKKTNPIRGDEIEKLELEPDAWDKFEKLIESAAKMGPKPHVSKKKTASKT